MKKILTFLCLLMLGAGMSVQAQMVVKWGDSDNYDISVEITDDTDEHESIYVWGSEGSEYFVKISAVDKNKLSTNTNFAELEMYIHIGENSGNTRTYNDGNGGTFQGPKVNEEGYPIIVPYLKYQNYYYYVDQEASAEYVVGYAREYGSYGYGRCNQSSFYYGTNGTSMYSITKGRVVVKEGKNGTMFLAHYDNSNVLLSTIGEENPEDGTITAVSSDNSKGTVSGTVVGSGADFASGTEYDAETQITLNANALSGYTFLKWNEDSNTENPRTITVNGNATYTAVFAPTHTITVNSADASKGTATGGGLYAEGATVKISAIGNDGYVFTQWSDGNTDNPRTITVSSDGAYTAQFAVETASWGSYSYDNANDIIQVDIDEGADNICDSYWSPYGGDFLSVIASNHTRSTSNYVQLYFKTNTMDYTYPDGRLGVAPGIYVTTTPNEVTNWCGSSLYWLWNWEAIPWEGAVAYTYSSEIGLNDQSCYAADVNYSGNSPSFTQRYKIGNYNDGTEAKIIVAEGKDGHMYVQVRKVVDNTLLVSIGEPAPSVSNSTATLTPPTNGTITLHNDDTDADVVFTENAATIADGTTLTITANGIKGYHCTGITVNDEPLVGSTYTVDGDFVIAATFAANTHNVSWVTDGNALTGTYTNGTVNYGTTIVAPNTPTKTATAQYTYTFNGWSPAVDATMPDNDVEYTATWTETPVNYTLTWTTDGDALTGTYTTGTTAYGTTIVAPATPTKDGFTFVGWDADNDGVVDDVAATMPAANTTYTATWREIFELKDGYEEGNDYYAAYNSKKDENKKLDVLYKRTFGENKWSTFALPFGYSLRANTNHPFYGHVYSLVSAKYEKRGDDVYLTLNCVPNTTSIKANTPYVLITGEEAINYPVFNNVRLVDIKKNTETVVQDVNEANNQIRFVNTTCRQRIDTAGMGGVDALNKRVIFLQGNHLHYPNGAVWMNAFRGYFYMDYSTIYHVQPRVRLVMPDGESIEQAPDTDQPATVETKKYIENGILVIERAGMKYDAQGHIIK